MNYQLNSFISIINKTLFCRRERSGSIFATFRGLYVQICAFDILIYPYIHTRARAGHTLCSIRLACYRQWLVYICASNNIQPWLTKTLVNKSDDASVRACLAQLHAHSSISLIHDEWQMCLLLSSINTLPGMSCVYYVKAGIMKISTRLFCSCNN